MAVPLAYQAEYTKPAGIGLHSSCPQPAELCVQHRCLAGKMYFCRKGIRTNPMSTPHSSHRWTNLAWLLLLLAALGLRFPDFFQSPNSKVIEPYADGLKAYTNIEYHARYDSSLTYFQGMNYPYGDHASAAVTQPLVSGLIKLVSDYVVDITGYTRAIIHFSLLLGIGLASLFLMLLLRRLGCHPWWAMAAGLGVAFLSPQLHRFISHYGLAHLEVIPVMLYLLARLEEAHSLKFSFLMALAVAAFSLIHFYYFAIMAMTLGLYFGIGFLRKPGIKRLLKYALHYGVQVGLPLVFFYFWMYHNSSITDRAARPWGFFHFHAIWENLVTSPYIPWYQYIDQHWIKIQQSYEGQAYLGLVAIVGLLAMLGRWAGSRFRQPFVRAGGKLQPFLAKALGASSILLLLSFGLPFTLPGLEGYLDYTGPYQQFRSVGRFNWPFYYVANIVVLAELWHWVAKQQDNLRLGAGIAALLLLGAEAWYSANGPDLRLDSIAELEEGRKYTDLPGIDWGEFQAVLPVPYFNLGSDNFWYETEGLPMPRTLIIGIQTGLPTTGAALTRTSRGQAIRQLELVHEPYRLPRILADFPNGKPLLMLVDNHHFSQQKARYAHLLEGAQLIYESDSYRLYRQPLQAFEDRIAARAREIRYRIANDSTGLFPVDGCLATDATAGISLQSFDTLRSARYYRGGGAFQGLSGQRNVLFDQPIPKQFGTGWYNFSAWVYIDQDRLAQAEAHFEEYEPETGAVVKAEVLPLHRSLSVVDTNGWALFEKVFIPQRSDTKVRLWVQHPRILRDTLWVDELLVRPDAVEVYRQGPGYVYRNNRWFPVGG